MAEPGNEPQTVSLAPFEAESIDTLSKRLASLEKDFSEQKANSKNIINGVLLASVFILVTVAVEVILFHSNTNFEKQLGFQSLPRVQDNLMCK